MALKYNIKILALAALATMMSFGNYSFLGGTELSANAANCPALKIVFARGSGGERWKDDNYLAFRDSISEKLNRFNIDYEFEDLDYPAIGMDIENIWSVLGAYFGSGESYEFGDSVDKGVNQLVDMVNNKCPNTRYVIGGYSQGAMVVSKSLHSLNADRIIYAATFGDPKLYLPEGEGLIPAACRGDNLSDYRMYVPDCMAYEGMLGSYRPYEPLAYVGKVGTWCNKFDIFCSSFLGLNSHLTYVKDNLYEDASKVIAAKVLDALQIDQKIYSEHDTAFLIDSTGSMDKLIDKYKEEAMNLARQTLENGGRVALYDYRDLNDPYYPVKHCDFETCDFETFQQGLSEIEAADGGDSHESLLSASLTVMNELHWKVGATKSLVILTDDGYHNPDIDGVSLEDVVKLSKEIDPVNIYVVTNESFGETYLALADATDGMVVKSTSELELLTKTIMERYDSLPRVEENEQVNRLPELEIVGTNECESGNVKIEFQTNASHVILVVNDTPLGLVDGNSVEVGELDRSISNTISLVPLSETRRGIAKNVTIESNRGGETVPGAYTSEMSMLKTLETNMFVPGAPNTGKGE